MDDLRESMFYPTSFISVKFSALPRCKYRVSRLGFLSIYLFRGFHKDRQYPNLGFGESLYWRCWSGLNYWSLIQVFNGFWSGCCWSSSINIVLLPFITCFTIVILGMENLGAKRFWVLDEELSLWLGFNHWVNDWKHEPWRILLIGYSTWSGMSLQCHVCFLEYHGYKVCTKDWAHW